MKVVKKPDTTNWKYEHTCSTCDAVLEVEVGDVNHEVLRGDRPADPDSDVYYSFCVVCQTRFTVPEGKLNKGVKHAAKTKSSRSGSSYFDR